MATSATLTTGNTSKSQYKEKISIFKPILKKKYVQIQSWLAFKVGQRLAALEKNSWGLLIYILSLPPYAQLNPSTLSERTGHSRSTIFEIFKFLTRVGHLRVIKVRNEKNKIIGAEYQFYAVKFAWRESRNLDNCEIIEENGNVVRPDFNKNSNLENHGESRNLDNCEIIEENDISLKRACARAYHLGSNNSSSSNNGVLEVQPSEPDKAAAAFPDEIELEIKGNDSFDRGLVQKCLAFGVEYTLEAIRFSKQKAPLNPGAFFRGAALSRYGSVDARINARKPRPKSYGASPQGWDLEKAKKESSENEDTFAQAMAKIDKMSLAEKVEVAKKISGTNKHVRNKLRPVFGPMATESEVGEILKKRSILFAIVELWEEDENA